MMNIRKIKRRLLPNDTRHSKQQQKNNETSSLKTYFETLLK